MASSNAPPQPVEEDWIHNPNSVAGGQLLDSTAGNLLRSRHAYCQALGNFLRAPGPTKLPCGLPLEKDGKEKFDHYHFSDPSFHLYNIHPQPTQPLLHKNVRTMAAWLIDWRASPLRLLEIPYPDTKIGDLHTFHCEIIRAQPADASSDGEPLAVFIDVPTGAFLYELNKDGYSGRNWVLFSPGHQLRSHYADANARGYPRWISLGRNSSDPKAPWEWYFYRDVSGPSGPLIQMLRFRRDERGRLQPTWGQLKIPFESRSHMMGMIVMDWQPSLKDGYLHLLSQGREALEEDSLYVQMNTYDLRKPDELLHPPNATDKPSANTHELTELAWHHVKDVEALNPPEFDPPDTPHVNDYVFTSEDERCLILLESETTFVAYRRKTPADKYESKPHRRLVVEDYENAQVRVQPELSLIGISSRFAALWTHDIRQTRAIAVVDFQREEEEGSVFRYSADEHGEVPLLEEELEGLADGWIGEEQMFFSVDRKVFCLLRYQEESRTWEVRTTVLGIAQALGWPHPVDEIRIADEEEVMEREGTVHPDDSLLKLIHLGRICAFVLVHADTTGGDRIIVADVRPLRLPRADQSSIPLAMSQRIEGEGEAKRTSTTILLGDERHSGATILSLEKGTCSVIPQIGSKYDSFYDLRLSRFLQYEGQAPRSDLDSEDEEMAEGDAEWTDTESEGPADEEVVEEPPASAPGGLLFSTDAVPPPPPEGEAEEGSAVPEASRNPPRRPVSDMIMMLRHWHPESIASGGEPRTATHVRTSARSELIVSPPIHGVDGRGGQTLLHHLHVPAHLIVNGSVEEARKNRQDAKTLSSSVQPFRPWMSHRGLHAGEHEEWEVLEDGNALWVGDCRRLLRLASARRWL